MRKLEAAENKSRPRSAVDKTDSNPLEYAGQEGRLYEPRFAVYPAGWVLIALLAGYVTTTVLIIW